VAIKGKRRTRPRAAAQAPRPSISARRTPIALRRDVKRTVVIVLSLLSILGGLRVWQNVSRSDAVRSYVKKLGAAQQFLLIHLDQNSLTNVQSNVQQFTSGKLEAAKFIQLADLWEKDFRAAEDAMKKVKPPNKLLVQAQALIVDGVDGYVGLARLYNVAGQIMAVADTEKDPAQKKLISDKVQVVLTHAMEWQQRSDTVYNEGNKVLQDLLVRYGITPKQPQQQQQPTG